jgi:cytochrome c oxidase subunit 1
MSDSLVVSLRALPRADRRLLTATFVAALVALAIGIVLGLLTALVRARVFTPEVETGYRAMTGHGVAAFFYWLYFAQVGLLLAFAATRTGAGRLAARPLAWAGIIAMTLGLVLGLLAPWLGTPGLYDASPDLVMDGAPGLGLAYVGYLFLALGLATTATAAIVTALGAKSSGRVRQWSSLGFAIVAWAGLLLVSAVAAANAFLPAALWSLGLAPMPLDYSTGWHILFHNLHYLPLMATVVVWYALVEEMTGVVSMFGARFSKFAFFLYLALVPPTSLYHMFLDPNLAGPVRAVGSLLSLFVGVPTVLVFAILVVSLETAARAAGARGLFGWIGRLPWRQPAMAAMGAAVVNLAFGGVFAFVLIQEKLAPLLSDTFFVPGYFHFLTVGTVTLSLLGAMTVMLPAVTGRAPWRPGFVAVLPWATTVGLLLFGLGGLLAGFAGAPRRTLDIAYDGAAPAAWQGYMALVGIGGAIMTGAVAAMVFALLRSLLAAPTAMTIAQSPTVTMTAPRPVAATGAVGQQAWTAPLAILLLLAGMYGATALAFMAMNGLPIAALGGGSH